MKKFTDELLTLLEMREKIVKVLEILEPLSDDAETLNDYNDLEMSIRTRIQEAEDDLTVARSYIQRRLHDCITGK